MRDIFTTSTWNLVKCDFVSIVKSCISPNSDTTPVPISHRRLNFFPHSLSTVPTLLPPGTNILVPNESGATESISSDLVAGIASYGEPVTDTLIPIESEVKKSLISPQSTDILISVESEANKSMLSIQLTDVLTPNEVDELMTNDLILGIVSCDVSVTDVLIQNESGIIRQERYFTLTKAFKWKRNGVLHRTIRWKRNRISPRAIRWKYVKINDRCIVFKVDNSISSVWIK